jgi:hypothetical protein
MLRLATLFASLIMVSGCASAGLWKVDSAGPAVQSANALGAVDLPAALYGGDDKAQSPDEKACIQDPNLTKCDGILTARTLPRLSLPVGAEKDRAGGNTAVVERLRLELALRSFYRTDPVFGSQEDRRNRLQQRLVAASDTNCAIFAENLYATQASTNALFGSAATALGGAGAIVTGVDTARLLAGMSGIATGLRAEVNEDYFRNLWVEALVKAIETDRDQRRVDMTEHAALSISKYPVEAAIAEALRYNGACSLVSGLKDVNQAVVIAADPAGLKTFNDTYRRAGFDSKFNLSVNSNGTNNRLASAAPLASASGALLEIATEEAVAGAAKADATGRVAAMLDGAPKTKAQADLDAAAVRIDQTKSPLKSYVDQLTALQASYTTLTTALAATTEAQTRSDTQDQMQANDAAAQLIKTPALAVIKDAEAKISNVAAQAVQPVPPPAK